MARLFEITAQVQYSVLAIQTSTHDWMRGTSMVTRPRGRPRRYVAETAIDAMLAVFWAQGFDATSLDDLGAAAGMSRPSNKEVLYQLALTRYRRHFLEAVVSRFTAERRLAPALRAGFDAAISFFSAGGPPARGCFELVTGLNLAGRSPALQAALAEGGKWQLRFALQRLERARAEGELVNVADIASRALLVRSTLESLAVNARLGSEPSTLRELAEASARMISADN